MHASPPLAAHHGYYASEGEGGWLFLDASRQGQRRRKACDSTPMSHTATPQAVSTIANENQTPQFRFLSFFSPPFLLVLQNGTIGRRSTRLVLALPLAVSCRRIGRRARSLSKDVHGDVPPGSAPPRRDARHGIAAFSACFAQANDTRGGTKSDAFW